MRQPAERYRRLGDESVVCLTLANDPLGRNWLSGEYTGFKQRLWFTTLTPAARKCEKLCSSYGQWAEIMNNVKEIHVVTS